MTRPAGPPADAGIKGRRARQNVIQHWAVALTTDYTHPEYATHPLPIGSDVLRSRFLRASLRSLRLSLAHVSSFRKGYVNVTHQTR